MPTSDFLKCTQPADVYLLLKSSDFATHDITPERVFEDVTLSEDQIPSYEIELVLRKWYPVDRSRELRCFVREGRLIGV